jgi:hypothetical protein
LSFNFNKLIKKFLTGFLVSPELSLIRASAWGIVHLMKYC